MKEELTEFLERQYKIIDKNMNDRDEFELDGEGIYNEGKHQGMYEAFKMVERILNNN